MMKVIFTLMLNLYQPFIFPHTACKRASISLQQTSVKKGKGAKLGKRQATREKGSRDIQSFELKKNDRKTQQCTNQYTTINFFDKLNIVRINANQLKRTKASPSIQDEKSNYKERNFLVEECITNFSYRNGRGKSFVKIMDKNG